MKTPIPLLILLFAAAATVFAEKAPSLRAETRKPLFEGDNPAETYREQLQKNRLQARIKRIQDLRKTIRAAFEESGAIAIQQKILDLGDECLNLHEVAEEEAKRLKKIKKLGDKINTQCETLSDKMESKGFEKSRERWKNIDELLDDLLGLVPQ